MTLTHTTADLLENESMSPRSDRPKRRSFTAKYKPGELTEHDAADPEARGVLLRRREVPVGADAAMLVTTRSAAAKSFCRRRGQAAPSSPGRTLPCPHRTPAPSAARSRSRGGHPQSGSWDLRARTSGAPRAYARNQGGQLSGREYVGAPAPDGDRGLALPEHPRAASAPAPNHQWRTAAARWPPGSAPTPRPGRRAAAPQGPWARRRRRSRCLPRPTGRRQGS